jgi:RNA polymerase sigma factor (sigma-70 family)
MKSDAQLLRDYAQHGSEPAFSELVARYTNIVYSAALRQVGNPDTAREICQTVFTDLGRKSPFLAARFNQNDLLTGWLYRAARFAALGAIRANRRRQAHERQFMQHLATATEASPEWERIAPVLDAAINSLSEADREPLLRRFFNNHSFRMLAESLGITEDAAQKRVTRGLEKLRAALSRQGLSTSASILSTALAANAVQVAPAGLALGLANASLATAGATKSTITVLKVMTITKLKFAAATLLAVLAAALVAEHHSLQILRAENDSLRNRPATAEPASAPPRARSLSASGTDGLDDLRKEHLELLRLRGEFARLTRAQAESTPPPQQNKLLDQLQRTAGGPTNLAISAVMNDFYQSIRTTNTEQVLKLVVGDPAAALPEQNIRDFLVKIGPRDISGILADPLNNEVSTADEVQRTIMVNSKAWGGGMGMRKLTLRNIAGEWKIVLFGSRDPSGTLTYVGFDRPKGS